MDYILNNTSDCTRELVATATKDEFVAVYNDALKKVQQNLKMPGFRPGKVPINIVTKQYGQSIKFEVLENMANDSIKKYIEEQKIHIVGRPQLTDIKEEEDGSKVFTILLEVIPDIELKDYKSIEIYEPVHRVTDAEIEEEINHLAKTNGTREEVEMVTDFNTIVTVDSYEINAETKEVIADVNPIRNSPIDLSVAGFDKLKQLLLNAKVGDEIENIPDGNENYKPEKLIIKKIEKITPCVIDDEFAKRITNERFENLEDLRQDIGFSIQKQWDDNSRKLMEDQIISKITELHEDFELPSALIDEAKKQILSSWSSQNPNLRIDNFENTELLEKYANSIVRVEIIKNKIIEKENLEVEDFDIENFVDDFYLRHPDIKLSATREAMIEHITHDEHTLNRLLQKKFMDFLMDFVKTNEIDFDEFEAMNTAKYMKENTENSENIENLENKENLEN